MVETSNIAAIANAEELDCQAFLSRAASEWQEAGAKVVGVLAEDNDVAGACSAGFLRDIASRRRFSIHLDTPPANTTCHLDADGMEDAGRSLLAQIPSADIVLLSKFGKLEAMKRGLWPAFSAAIAAGRPLLTTVSSRHVASWNAFAPDAVWVGGDPASIERWRRSIQPRPGR